MERELFLQNLRQALGREGASPPPEYPPLKERLQDQQRKVDALWARAEERRAELLERFLTMAEKAGWQTSRVDTPAAVVQQVVRLTGEVQAHRVVRSDQPVFQHVEVDSALEQTGVTVTTMSLGSVGSREALREAAIQADVGITGVDYAIAETGTCVLVPRRGVSRLVSLVPPVHVALVEPQQVVESLDDILALRRLEFLRGDPGMGSHMTFITGPSRTADIEQTLVVGVHGPKEVHLVLVG